MSSCAIILFTKAPVPGLVKTRLIDRSGVSPSAKDVAELYKSLLVDTLIAAKQACDATGSRLIISFRPKETETDIRNLVEPIFQDAMYLPQEGTSVTERVRDAFEFAFSKDFDGVSLIPGDHPDLDGKTLADAIVRTGNPSNPCIVLGPTFDGGAYLLGFNKKSFEKVEFSVEDTYRVCADILLKSKSAGIPCSFLENKNDIDDWDDAQRFLGSSAGGKDSRTRLALRRFSGSEAGREQEKKKLSIIIPTLNEGKNIDGILNSLSLQTEKNFEIIMVDGSSDDDTVSKAWSKVDKIAFVANPSRKRQENTGGFGAKGKVLLFLHADSVVYPTLCECVIRATASDVVIGGSCHALFDGVGTRYGFLNAMRRCGDKLLGIRGISSGFFVKRHVFISANGFRENVMEEAVDFQKRTRSWGKFVTLNQSIVSSSRRFAAKRAFIPTLAVWTTTVLLTYLGLHFTSIEKSLWNAIR
ncbi:MAG: DUF2064 domain-containing protein [Nitrososphaerales archaeon]